MNSPTLKLETAVPDHPATEMLFATSGFITLGREPENALVLDDTAVSRRHAVILSAGGEWFLRDLGSSNGSWLNGVQLTPGAVRVLRNGDVIVMATFPIRVLLNDAEERPWPVAGSKLLIFFGDDFRESVNVSAAGFRYVIGGPTGNILLDPEDGGTTGSVISYNGTSFQLDLGVGSRLQLNGMLVAGTTRLNDRDEIIAGPYRIMVSDSKSVSTYSGKKVWGGVSTGEFDVNPQARGRDWEAEVEQKFALSGRKSVFGVPVEEEDVSGTLSMDRESFAMRAGIESSASHRFSGASHEVYREPSEIGTKMTIVLGVVVFVSVIVAAALLFLV